MLRLSRTTLFAGTAAALCPTFTTRVDCSSEGCLPGLQFQPEISASPSEWNQAVLARMPTAAASYRLPRTLRNGHLETIYGGAYRKLPHLMYDREYVHMPDGGCVALDSEQVPDDQQLPEDAPVLILLPGITGGSEGSYVQYAARDALKAGIRAIVFNSRGNAGSRVTTPQFYSASYTEDLRNVIAFVQGRYPSSLLFATGWSLGANILTMYLAEEGENTPLRAVAAMCNPYNLVMCDKLIHTGIRRLYNWNLGNALRSIYRKHSHLFEAAAAKGEKAFKCDLARKVRTVREHDEAITCPTFGWPSVEAYYQGSSSAHVVHKVRVPYLNVQAADDPIAPKAAIPMQQLLDNPHCILVMTPTGGHLGWCSGKDGPGGVPWTNAVLMEYFAAMRELLGEKAGEEGVQGPGLSLAGAPSGLSNRSSAPEGVYTQDRTTHQAP